MSEFVFGFIFGSMAAFVMLHLIRTQQPNVRPAVGLSNYTLSNVIKSREKPNNKFQIYAVATLSTDNGDRVNKTKFPHTFDTVCPVCEFSYDSAIAAMREIHDQKSKNRAKSPARPKSATPRARSIN